MTKLGKTNTLFLSYAWTGEDEVIVRKRMEMICTELRRAGVRFYCNLYDEATGRFQTPGEFVKHALEQLKDCNALLAIVASERRSQGQLMEIGAAVAADKDVLTLMRRDVKGTGYLEDPLISSSTIYWDTEEELPAIIAELFP